MEMGKIDIAQINAARRGCRVLIPRIFRQYKYKDAAPWI